MKNSLKEMRARGYLCAIVEKVIPHNFIKQDMFGIIDVLCIRGAETVGLQVTSLDNLSAHRKKALASPNLRTWLRGGTRTFVLHGWSQGKDGKYLLKEQSIRLGKAAK